MKVRSWLIGLVAVLTLSGFASAAVISDSGSVSFTSDLEAPKVISLDPFTPPAVGPGQSVQFNSVTVTFTYDGSADIAGDVDDQFQGATMNARIIRTWTATGPGVTDMGDKTVTSPPFAASADDGDLDNFDSSAPDGHAFSTLNFANELSAGGAQNPATSLYTGPGNVDFTVTPSVMVNDLQFVVNPDAWQLEVQNPLLVVKAEVVYDYEIIPEPATMSLLVLGGLAMLRRRKR